MPGRYTYSRSQDQPYAVEMHPLPETEKSSLVQEARSTFRKLFAAIEIAKNDSDATRVAGVSGDAATTKSVMLCTTTTVYGTLEEVSALYVNDDSRIVLDFAESKRLYTLQEPSKTSPMRCVGMRWSRWKSPSKLVSDRDLVYLECMDGFTDQATGRRGWARCTKSIVHPCCPESQHPYGPIRAQLFCSGIVLSETDKFGVLEATSLVHINTHGVPGFVAQKALNSRKKTAQNVNHLLKLTRQMNGSQHDEVFADELADERACRSCNEHISKWTRARHCRYCDEILCKKCALISYSNADANGKTTRMCIDCGTGKKPRSAGGIAEDRALSPSALAALSLQAHHSYSKGRVNSSRSIDTESVDSAREDGESSMDLLHQLHHRVSPKSSTSSSSTSSSSTSASQHQQSSLRRINPRQRKTSNSSEVPSLRRAETAPPVMMDLSYLQNIVSATAKPKANDTTNA